MKPALFLCIVLAGISLGSVISIQASEDSERAEAKARYCAMPDASETYCNNL
jgi:hypothetical protein